VSYLIGQKRFFTESATSLEKVSKRLRPDLAQRLGPDPDLAQQQGECGSSTCTDHLRLRN